MDPAIPFAIDRLVVPLDGSRLAEATLPAAIAVSARLGAGVTLLHVLERNAPLTVHGDRHLTNAGQAEAYLHGVASRFADAGVTVVVHTHPNPEGDIAASIADHAAELASSLIVLCTHGHGGMRGWMSGSLAQQVIRRATPPVLLVRPGQAATSGPFAPEALLVALDGTPEAEAALPPALALARAFGARLHILDVVETLGTVAGDRAAAARLSPTATAALLDAEGTAAVSYLERMAARVRATGGPVSAELARGDAVRTVVERAQSEGAILALATHGRGGLDALWSGSVGAKVVARATVPLLLVHPGAASERRQPAMSSVPDR